MAKKQFKAESKRLLDLMINSIYTNKEIFLREIISNASDAIDKLCYLSLTDDKVGLDRGDYRIRITVDKDKRTITVSDNGIGMTKAATEIAQQRAEIVAEIQSRIMDAYNESKLGQTMEVLCEGWDEEEEAYFGRTYADSPDIDGKVWFSSDRAVRTGEFVQVRITDVYDGELIGEAGEEES